MESIKEAFFYRGLIFDLLVAIGQVDQDLVKEIKGLLQRFDKDQAP